jgi:hypothetical protein
MSPDSHLGNAFALPDHASRDAVTRRRRSSDLDGRWSRYAIEAGTDVPLARSGARRLAGALGFSSADATIVASMVSEIARTMLARIGRGDICLRPRLSAGRRALIVSARARHRPGRQFRCPSEPGHALHQVEVELADLAPIAAELRLRLLAEVGDGATVAVTIWKSRRMA